MSAPKSFQRVPLSAGRDAILKAFYEDGGVIIGNFITADQVKRLNEEIQPAMDELAAGSTHDDEWTKDFHGSNTKRLTNLVTRSKTFREELLDMTMLHELCEEIFLRDSGTYWLNTAQVIEIGRGNKAQVLHRDQMQYPIFTICGPGTPEATVNFIVALTEFTDLNGATRVIPGSHKWTDYSNNGNPEDTIAAEMEAGDACWISGKVVHGGGANRSEDFKRRGIAFSIHCSYLTPEEAYPFIVEKDLVKTLSRRAQSMIGFRSQFPKDSAGLWQSDYREIAKVIGLA
jgi:ectoine hydroxylase-related dioxygenase (phytanoyl-CoA dioxygenase family)